MKTPPGAPRSRSFTRLTMRVGLPHLGQSVLLVVSITFLRSAVLAILAIGSPSFLVWNHFTLCGSNQHSALSIQHSAKSHIPPARVWRQQRFDQVSSETHAALARLNADC
jgi:hypothetical protein